MSEDTTALTPGPMGLARSWETISGVAAPLLAGFAVSFIGLLLAADSASGWTQVALVLLVVAVVAMVYTLQAGFHARLHLATPDDLQAWYPEDMAAGGAAAERRRREQAESVDLWSRWVRRAAMAYNTGIVAFAVAIGCALVPPPEHPAAVGRLVAAMVAFAAALAEVGWIVHGRRTATKRAVQDPSAR